MMKLNVFRADPAGNITLFVTDSVPVSLRPAVAARLMELPRFKAEQVGFICEAPAACDGCMEMMAGEFCGNATRAFGYAVALEKGIKKGSVNVNVSGAGLCRVDVDTEKSTARVQVPVRITAEDVCVCGVKCRLMNLEGIAHLVTPCGIAASEDFFAEAEPVFERFKGIEAYGVIFRGDADEKGRRTLTPLVKVVSAGTLVFEGSCASGTLAAAAAESLEKPDGLYTYEYAEPRGVLEATVRVENGQITEAYIGGEVSVDPPETAEIETVYA